MAAKLLLGDPMVETKHTNSQFKSKYSITCLCLCLHTVKFWPTKYCMGYIYLSDNNNIISRQNKSMTYVALKKGVVISGLPINSETTPKCGQVHL